MDPVAGAVKRNETMGWAYVAVDSHTTRDGEVRPARVWWTDGSAYDVDEVCDTRRFYGDERERRWYLVRIGGQYRELWWDNPRWHVLVPPGRGGVRPHAGETPRGRR